MASPTGPSGWGDDLAGAMPVDQGASETCTRFALSSASEDQFNFRLQVQELRNEGNRMDVHSLVAAAMQKFRAGSAEGDARAIAPQEFDGFAGLVKSRAGEWYKVNMQVQENTEAMKELAIQGNYKPASADLPSTQVVVYSIHDGAKHMKHCVYLVKFDTFTSEWVGQNSWGKRDAEPRIPLHDTYKIYDVYLYHIERCEGCFQRPEVLYHDEDAAKSWESKAESLKYDSKADSLKINQASETFKILQTMGRVLENLTSSPQGDVFEGAMVEGSPSDAITVAEVPDDPEDDAACGLCSQEIMPRNDRGWTRMAQKNGIDAQLLKAYKPGSMEEFRKNLASGQYSDKPAVAMNRNAIDEVFDDPEDDARGAWSSQEQLPRNDREWTQLAKKHGINAQLLKAFKPSSMDEFRAKLAARQYSDESASAMNRDAIDKVSDDSEDDGAMNKDMESKPRFMEEIRKKLISVEVRPGDSSTECPSSEEDMGKQFVESLSDPENASITERCLQGVGDGDESVLAYYKVSLKCSDAVLKNIETQKQSQEDVWNLYGEEAACLRADSENVSKKLAAFCQSVMKANTDVQTITVCCKLGMQWLKKLKEESVKGALADKKSLAKYASKAVQYLQDGKVTEETALKLESVKREADELRVVAAEASKALQLFIEEKEAKMTEMLEEGERELRFKKEEMDLEITALQNKFDAAKHDKEKAESEVVEAKTALESHKNQADLMRREHAQTVSEARAAQDEANDLKEKAKRATAFSVGLGIFGLVALGIATFATGGAAAPAFGAYAAWVASNAAGFAVAGLVLNEGYGFVQGQRAKYKQQRSEDLLEQASQKQKDSAEALRQAALVQKQLDEKLVQAEKLGKEELEHKTREIEALRAKQTTEVANAKAVLAETQATARELQQKFHTINDLANRYKEVLGNLKGVNAACDSMITSLKSLRIVQLEAVDAEELAEGDAQQLIEQLACTFSLKRLEDQIAGAGELQAMNDELLRKAQRIFNDYHKLTGQ